nr:DUF732 domain-containing protein [uncultured Actinoplanes sp.]
MRAPLTACLVALATAGCSPGTDRTTVPPPAGRVVSPVPQATTTQPAAAAPTRTGTTAGRRPQARRTSAAAPSIDRFVAAVQRQMPQVALDRRDDEVAELGEEACRSLAAGKRDAAVATAISEYGVAATDARQLVALARATACRV